MNSTDILYVGVKGHVLAFNKANGTRLWETELRAGGFVTLLVDGAYVFAHTVGHLHCLDAQTGTELWMDDLPGMGYGLGSLAVQGASAPSLPAVAEMAVQKAASNSGGGADGGGGS